MKKRLWRWSTTLIFGLSFLLPSSGSSEQQNRIIVDQYPTPSSEGPQPAVTPPASNDIRGIRIESNGALITGPLNARRVYIRLDSAIVPPQFRAVWVGDRALCALARDASRSNPENMPDGTILLTSRQLFGRRNYDVNEIFVPLPDTFTLEMLDSGKQLVLPASDHQSAPKVLIIVSSRDKGRDYFVLSLADQGSTLKIGGQNGADTAIRCDAR